jgi:hypothetical protein
MKNNPRKLLTAAEEETLLHTLQDRFEKFRHRHPEFSWEAILGRLEGQAEKKWSLFEMERTGGEPDVVGRDASTGEYLFCDCAPESPAGRRSVCYDQDALDARKEHKPAHSALGMAAEMGIELLTEEQYRVLQRLGPFDTKTSSWVRTSAGIRNLGGALFGDYRYGQVFIYHNGASSYYAARGFRGQLRV